MKLGDILTPFEIDTVLDLWRNHRDVFHTLAVQDVCVPACSRRSDVQPEYLAYLLEYVLTNREKYVPNFDIRETEVSSNEPKKPSVNVKKRVARKVRSKLP